MKAQKEIKLISLNVWGGKKYPELMRFIKDNAPSTDIFCFQKIIIGGGPETNTAFLKENLINEIILDLEPMLFGKGLPLFSAEDFDAKLKLIGSKNINENLIQLHYAVL